MPANKQTRAYLLLVFVECSIVTETRPSAGVNCAKQLLPALCQTVRLVPVFGTVDTGTGRNTETRPSVWHG